MTEVVAEKVNAPQGEAPAEPEATATPAEATPKTVKSDGDRIREAIQRGQNKPKHEAFAKWISDSTNGEVEADYNTIVLVMSLINGYRATPEFKELSARLAAEGGSSAGVKEATPKTPEEIREFAKKAEEQLARQAKAKANAEARADRARQLLAQLEAEESGDEGDVDEDELVDDSTEDADEAF